MLLRLYITFCYIFWAALSLEIKLILINIFCRNKNYLIEQQDLLRRYYLCPIRLLLPTLLILIQLYQKMLLQNFLHQK